MKYENFGNCRYMFDIIINIILFVPGLFHRRNGTALWTTPGERSYRQQWLQLVHLRSVAVSSIPATRRRRETSL